MKNSNSTRMRPGQESNALAIGFRSLLLAIQAGLCLHTASFACPVDTLSLSKLPLEIQVVSDQRGQVRIQLLAGDVADPVKNLMGFDLQFYLDAGLQPGATSTYLPAGAWTTSDDLFSATIAVDQQTGTVSLSFRRDACQAVSGHGLLGEILINGLEGAPDPEELVRLTAGLVLEEVVNGARVAPSAAAGITDMTLEEGLRPAAASTQIEVWPQPAGELLHWAFPESVPPGQAVEVSLLDLQGRVLKRQRTTDPSPLNLSGIPKGTYFLHCRGEDGHQFSRRIYKS